VSTQIDPNSPQGIAIAQVEAICVALVAIGGRGTIEQISAAVDLTADVVGRRLRSAGPQCPRQHEQKFAKDRNSDCWCLTGLGRRIGENKAKGA
jgi:hypothetical protein